ncbi:MAG: carboxypeptidase regulatory-like domain-containing protein [Deltaproteobacteria bacterium]|nr:carboxypeptidase regulatory-like domain-containing protein [Deltaproteobacteria bacterium]
MLSKKIYRRKCVFLGLIFALLLLFFPVEAVARESSAPGAMVGFIYAQDLKTPVKDAVVKIRDIKEGREYQSTPTDENGLYRIKDIEEGRYILGVTADEKDFNFDYVILIKANEMAKLSLALKPGASMLLGQEGKTEKKADEEEESKKKPFFATAFGTAVLVAAGALGIVGAVGLVRAKPTAASPSKKK